MKKLNIRNKEFRLLILFGVFVILFITVNSNQLFSSMDVDQRNINFENDSPKTSAPTINIIAPTGGSSFNSTAPGYIVRITDPSLNTTWYTLNTNQTKHIFTDNGTIDGWKFLADGLVNITFHANDSLGAESLDFVLVTKDTIDPGIPLLFSANPLSWTNVDSFNLTWSNPVDTSGIAPDYAALPPHP